MRVAVFPEIRQPRSALSATECLAFALSCIAARCVWLADTPDATGAVIARAIDRFYMAFTPLP